MQKFDVIYVDDDLVVVNKAPLLPCHPLPIGSKETLIELMAEEFPEVIALFEGDREGGLCHRLDNDTSGLVLIARHPDVKKQYRELFQTGQIEKTYLALVKGRIDLNVEINTPIAHHQKNKRKMVALNAPHIRYRSHPQEAKTQGRVVLNNNAGTLLRVRIEGGRRHQIRVHLASLGFPLVGDVLYGAQKAEFILGHALHAATLTLPSGQKLEAPCPKEWEDELLSLDLVRHPQ